MRAEERRYYDLLAPEYEDWALAQGAYARNVDPAWEEEFRRLLHAVAALPPGKVLDVACGTGIFTRHLHGEVVGLDQSEAMVEVARRRCPDARFVAGDALDLPFENDSFDLFFSANFYGHLRRSARKRFLEEARRVASSLVVVEVALRPGSGAEAVQTRVLRDGSRHEIYRRFFRLEELAEEIGGRRAVFSGEWFVAVGDGPAVGGPVVEPRTTDLGTVAESAGELLERLVGDPRTRVKGLSCDWRRARDGDLFFCVEPHYRERAAASAGAMGATALCVDRPTDLGLAQIVVRDVRQAMARVSADFFGRPADDLTLFGVTGTKGKTTTSLLVKSILAAAGRPVGFVGTLGTWIGDDERPGLATTPESCDLHAVLAEMRAAGVEAVSLEVSSYGLAFERIHGLRFASVAFTNLTHDHLDVHGTMQSYFEAKRLLLTPEYADAAAVNVDDQYGRKLAATVDVQCIGFGFDREADVRAEEVKLGREGTEFVLRTPTGAAAVRTPLVGTFNVYNCLAAAAVALQGGIGLDAIAAGLARQHPLPGRFQVIEEGQSFRVVVDYAHTPASLESALVASRLVAGEGKVICVFGCGGGRDTTKRAPMGSVAARLADIAVVTSDNPRREEPDAIIREILMGIPDGRSGIEVLPDRREAIAHALATARAGDVVLIAGKGSERFQEVGRRKIPFDDREVARGLLRDARS
jgi:UDP-N-acetylmuramoyl-L-alanyl-D-glutamate--2,6-diaminopimelate ligase